MERYIILIKEKTSETCIALLVPDSAPAVRMAPTTQSDTVSFLPQSFL